MGDLNLREFKEQLAGDSGGRTLAIFGGWGRWLEYAEVMPLSWEVWGLNDMYIKRYDAWFEMHSMRNIRNRRGNLEHYQWLQECEKPIWMLKKHKSIPNSIEYPIEEMLDKYGPIFTNSFDYMLAMAIEQEFKKIWIFGVAFATIREYMRERQSYCYMLGVCKGLGIKFYPYYDIMRIQHIYQYPKIDVEKYWFGECHEKELWEE